MFQPPGGPRGSVVLSPGRTEFIEKYFEVIGELQARGFVVAVHDWRGQGLSDRLHSDRLRGHAGVIDEFIGDFGALLDQFEPRLPRPWINLSHSMGSAFTTLALAGGEARFAGSIFSAPMFGLLTTPIPAGFARGATRCLNWIGQAGACVPEQPAARLSHDMEREGRWRGLLQACPDLEIRGFTWGWLEMAFQASGRLARTPGLGRIEGPFVVLAAGIEDLVSNAAARRLAERVKGGRFQVVEDAYHELLMETDPVRDRFWAEFDRLAAEVTPLSG